MHSKEALKGVLLFFFGGFFLHLSVFRDGLNYRGLDVLRGGFSTSWTSRIYLSRNPRLLFASHRKINLFVSADGFILVFCTDISHGDSNMLLSVVRHDRVDSAAK